MGSLVQQAPFREVIAKADRARSRFAVVLLALPLVLGLLIQVKGPSATLFGLQGPTCVVGEVLGAAGCPGCGLTRSTALALHGDLAGAAALNWAGLVLVVACVLGLVLHLDILIRAGRRTARHGRLLTVGTHLFGASVLVAWLIRLV
jgi:Protein of unknown function (DUF2752)